MFKLSNKLIAGFICMFVTVSIYLLYVSYEDIIDAHEQAKNIVGNQEKKHRLVTKLYVAARERSLILLTMHSTSDAFELDDLNLKMSKEAADFIRARKELDKMDMQVEELEIYKKQLELVKLNSTLQNKVADLYIDDQRERAEKVMFDAAIPGQRLVLDKISEMLELYEMTSDSVIAEIEEHYQQASNKFQLLLLSVVVASIIFAVIIAIISRREKNEAAKAADDMAYLASHDSLTGLINRWEFENKIEKLLKNKANADIHYVLYLDLDQFKIVNDTCGHSSGDAVLIDIASILNDCVRKDDIVARIGGDEFGIILHSCNEIPAINTSALLIKSIQEYRYCFHNKVFHVGVSIGLGRMNGTLTNVETIMQEIDSACYVAKDNGGGRYHLYDNNNHEIVKRKSEMSWIVKIEDALENDNFVLYAQPIVPVYEGDARVNYEILLRLKSNNGELIAPDKFLPSAERYNKMIAVDQWVIKNAFTMLSENIKFLELIDYCSVNLSCQSLSDDDFLEFAINQFSFNTNLKDKICFEITETAAISNPLKANRFVSILRTMGIRFALDDFGCGLASFEYLKKLSVDYLKIDGMFIKNIVSNPIDRAMVKSIVEVGKVMNKTIIAEYVENYEILKELRVIGVDYAQGYGVGKPKPLFLAINKKDVEFGALRYAKN